jgi:hypothetical protein
MIKIMLICFFNIRGIIHFEFVTKGTTFNQTFFVEVLKRLIHAVRRKRGELRRECSLILCYDNKPGHSSLQVSQFLAGKDISALDHLPYCTDLGPADFWLSPKLTSVLNGQYFSDIWQEAG